MGRFLECIVLNALDQQAKPLKEYVIGVEVFERGPEFDPRTSSVVRVEARRLRRKLDEYYSGIGMRDPVVIELPRGFYAPRFRLRPASFGRTLEPKALRARPALALLPLSIDDRDRQLGEFGESLAEEVATALAKWPEVGIASRRATSEVAARSVDNRYIARQLGVTAVLAGKIRRSGKKVRLGLELADAESGFVLWSAVFESDTAALEASARRLARKIARAVAEGLLKSKEEPLPHLVAGES